VADLLRDADFYSPQHQLLYRAMIDLFNESEPVDIVTVQARLQDRDQLEAVGGTQYLVDLQEAAPTAAAISHYARIVQEKATLRALIRAGGQIQEAAQRAGDEELETVVAHARATLEAASERGARKAELVPWAEMLDDPDEASHLVKGILPDAGLVVIAASGGQGKGWVALTLGDAVSSHRDWLGEFPVNRSGLCVYADGERGRRYMAARVKDITRATGARPNVRFYFRPPKFDAPWVRMLVERERPVLLILDSLSRLLPPGAKDSDNAVMSEVLGALRDVAERFGCCILVIHHFRKRGEFADNSPVARVRGATAIVDVADAVLAVGKQRDGTLRVETVKSYWGDPAPPFLCAWQGGENGGTSLIYAGPADPEKVTKVDLACELILAACDMTPQTREQLDALCGKHEIPRRTVTDALKRIQGDDRLRRSMDGHKAVFGIPV